LSYPFVQKEALGPSIFVIERENEYATKSIMLERIFRELFEPKQNSFPAKVSFLKHMIL